MPLCLAGIPTRMARNSMSCLQVWHLLRPDRASTSLGSFGSFILLGHAVNTASELAVDPGVHEHGHAQGMLPPSKHHRATRVCVLNINVASAVARVYMHYYL